MNRFTLLLPIVFLAMILRLFALGSVPASLDWDEVSLGYNAYSILKTGRDEYGNFLPFSIRSFNDYKPPLYVYLTIPSVAVFGLTDFAVRLPSVLIGLVAVIFMYLLTQEIFVNHHKKHLLSVFSSVILAISPWHLQFSRAAFEANMALTCYLGFLYFFLKWINSVLQKKLQSTGYILLATVFAVGALYGYHSARVVVPLMTIALAFLYKKKLWERKLEISLAIGLGLILIIPLVVLTFRGSTNQRFTATSVFTNTGEFSRERERLDRAYIFKKQHLDWLSVFHKKTLTLGWIISRNYLEHVNFDFLFLRGDGNPRHSATGMGLMYLIEVPLVIVGLFTHIHTKIKHKPIIWLILVLGPMPAALTASTPHTIRSLLMMPAFTMFSGLGCYVLLEKISQLEIRDIIKNFLFALSCLLFATNIFYYLNSYYVVYPVKSSQDWQYGYKQLVEKVNKLENQYDQVIITNKYDQAHIFYAFYTKIDPKEYQMYAETASSQIGKIRFKQVDTEDLLQPKTLVALSPGELKDEANIVDQVDFLDGSVALYIATRE